MQEACSETKLRLGEENHEQTHISVAHEYFSPMTSNTVILDY